MIIGRIKQIKILEKLYTSQEAEFVVVFGRRRVGKTYLIREFFKQKKCQFLHATGLQKGNLKIQLKKFSNSLSEAFFNNIAIQVPKNWGEAFGIINQQIDQSEHKIIIFLDELPWMATKKSGLLQEIDYYWNRYWSSNPKVMLIVCGSQASWLIKKIIYNYGGLHNRTTCQINLLPFSLAETKLYLNSRYIKLNNEHIINIYMALGGVPFYLRYITPGLSAEQNIQMLLFDQDAPLKNEFAILFVSLFAEAESYLEILRLLGKKKEGIFRAELKAMLKLSGTGGSLSTKLQDLQATGFIQEYISLNRVKGEYYKLVDEFTLFYLHWIAPLKNKKFLADHWLVQTQKSAYYAWAGYAFEAICMKHITEILTTLKITTGSSISPWRYVPKIAQEQGAQIDLIIDRHDNSMTLCEIKYTKQPYVIDKEYYKKLMAKITVFKTKTGTTKQIFLALISAAGVQVNMYSEEIIDGGVVVLADLFKLEN